MSDKMKKYFAILPALLALIMSSCSNDDVPVSKSVTFKINPATVVENLYERNAGDLTSLSYDSSLIVSLYIYDTDGKLVATESQEFDAYTKVMTANMTLQTGSYTAVAVSNVTSSVNFWDISGYDNISTFKITDNGYIGGKDKILGLTVTALDISEYNSSIDINIRNAGAVACVVLANWNRYSDVTTYGLLGKQSCDYISFNTYGSVDYSIESKSDYSFYKVKYGYDPEYNGASGYFFTFPIKNAAMKFFAETTDNTTYLLGSNLVDDIKLGDSYLIRYDVTNETTDWYDMTPTRSNGSEAPQSDAAPADKEIVYDSKSMSISIR